MRLWQKRADGQGDLYRVNRRVDGRRRHDRQRDRHYNPAELYRRADYHESAEFIDKILPSLLPLCSSPLGVFSLYRKGVVPAVPRRAWAAARAAFGGGNARRQRRSGRGHFACWRC